MIEGQRKESKAMERTLAMFLKENPFDYDAEQLCRLKQNDHPQDGEAVMKDRPSALVAGPEVQTGIILQLCCPQFPMLALSASAGGGCTARRACHSCSLSRGIR
ncbi:MAG: hypothetical protein ACLVJ6_14070 [Merdibacter sp.]